MSSPEDASPLRQALEAHQRGALTQAESLYRAALSAQPDQADAQALLAVVLAEQGGSARVDEALSLIDRALKQDASSSLFFFYQGNIRMTAQDYDGAMTSFKRALALEPGRPEFLYNCGNAARLAGAWDEAKAYYEASLKNAPNHLEAMNNLALVLEYEGRLDAAVTLLETATSRAPSYAEGWLNLCNLAEKAGRFDLSCRAGERATALRPENPSAWFGLGVALNKTGHDEEALDAYRNALRLRPDWAEVWDNQGQTLQSLGRLDEAEDAFRRAIASDGQNIAGEDTRRVEESAYGHRHWHLALLELLKGDLARGFARYRARFRDVGGLARLKGPQPVWQGEDLAGKTILVMDEQGLGDALMMARYLPLLKARGARVLFLAHPALVPLFHGWGCLDALIAHGHPLPPFDVYASIFDLPYAFGTTLQTIPAAPYLPMPEVQEALRLPPLSDDKTLRIGLCWAGAPLHKQDGKRTLPLDTFAPLVQGNAAAQFYSLTRDARAGDGALMASLEILDLAPRLHNLAHTAQIIAQLDLVITCDTSTAHMAGGLGRPVWILLPFDPDWRWLLGREDSPWYPSMRLFRQSKKGDWASTIRAASDALSS